MENTKNKFGLEKKVILVEAIFVFGALIYIYFSMSPTAVSPISGQTILEPDFVFEVQNGDEVWISTNDQFTNSVILKENSEADFPPGTYYWKVKNWLRESKVQSFTIQSNVGLNLRRGSEKDLLENSGNVPVDVTKKEGGITSSVGLDSGRSVEVEKDNSTYEGKQNG